MKIPGDIVRRLDEECCAHLTPVLEYAASEGYDPAWIAGEVVIHPLTGKWPPWLIGSPSVGVEARSLHDAALLLWLINGRGTEEERRVAGDYLHREALPSAKRFRTRTAQRGGAEMTNQPWEKARECVIETAAQIFSNDTDSDLDKHYVIDRCKEALEMSGLPVLEDRTVWRHIKSGCEIPEYITRPGRRRKRCD